MITRDERHNARRAKRTKRERETERALSEAAARTMMAGREYNAWVAERVSKLGDGTPVVTSHTERFVCQNALAIIR